MTVIAQFGFKAQHRGHHLIDLMQALVLVCSTGARPHPSLDQREHEFPRCDVVHLRSVSATRHDPRSGVLPQEVLRSAARCLTYYTTSSSFLPIFQSLKPQNRQKHFWLMGQNAFTGLTTYVKHASVLGGCRQ